eukprot:10576858-Alexandrium_andersonii.AAC.1
MSSCCCSSALYHSARTSKPECDSSPTAQAARPSSRARHASACHRPATCSARSGEPDPCAPLATAPSHLPVQHAATVQSPEALRSWDHSQKLGSNQR